MTQIYWTSRADADLMALHDFAARNSGAYASLLVQRMLQSVKRLEDFPLSGRSVPEFPRADIRELIVAPYRIVYRVLETEVHVLIVQHGARQLPDVLPL
jgi:toxin ParE1/3/4